jgi:hypothetical protein
MDTPFWGRKHFLILGAPKSEAMKNILLTALLLTSGAAFAQLSEKAILGAWVCCDKVELLAKTDSFMLVKESPAAKNECVEKKCVYTVWTFEKTRETQEVKFNRQSGCKDAASMSSYDTKGTWSFDKGKKAVTIFDEHFTKLIFNAGLTKTGELKLKRQR